MSNLFELAAVVRQDKGKGASRRLRRLDQLVPGIIYGGEKEPVLLSLKENEVRKALQNEAFYSHILTINVDGKKEKAILKDLQRHPAKPMIYHMDFLRVSGKEAITMHVPLHFTGEENAPGVKDGGIVSHLKTDLEIKCLPKDLPEFIEVDVSNLALDQSLHLTDIKLAKGLEHAHGPIDADHDLPVVSIHVPKAAPVEEAPADVAAEDEADSASGEDTPDDTQDK